jgi:hypothetical protein
MSIRIKALIISLIQLLIFSVLTGFTMLVLFHIAILGFPLFAFMWTFWGFSLFTLITGVNVKLRHSISFAAVNFLLVALLLVAFIMGSVIPKSTYTLLLLILGFVVTAKD